MKQYETPSLKDTLFLANDVIAVSQTTDSIVSSSDSAVAAETQESSWDESWN